MKLTWKTQSEGNWVLARKNFSGTWRGDLNQGLQMAVMKSMVKANASSPSSVRCKFSKLTDRQFSKLGKSIVLKHSFKLQTFYGLVDVIAVSSRCYKIRILKLLENKIILSLFYFNYF